MEKKRLKHLHRQFSDELQSIEQDIMQASLNKLRREASERSADVSEISDGYLSPLDDTESVSSDIFGAADSSFSGSLVANGGDSSRPQRKSSRFLMRLDENSEMGPPPMSPRGAAGHVSDGASSSRARPVTRRSISRELFEDRPKSLARPVARRSVSRELFDVNFTPGGAASSWRKEMPDLDSMRRQMRERERSMSREFDRFCADSAASFMPESRAAR